MKTIKVIELFAGGGGFRLGLEKNKNFCLPLATPVSTNAFKPLFLASNRANSKDLNLKFFGLL